MPKHKKDKHARSIGRGQGKKQAGVPPTVNEKSTGMGIPNASQQHDASRRLGDFAGTGNHPRTGNPGHQ